MSEPRELLMVKEACARAGVSRRTIYNWMGAGLIDFIRTAGGSPRIYADTLFTADGESRRRRAPNKPKTDAEIAARESAAGRWPGHVLGD